MSNRELYRETFSQVRFEGTIDIHNMEKKRRPHGTKRIMILAAVVALLAVFSTAAVADRWFGLRSLELEEEVTVTQPDGEQTAISVPTGTISLQGFDDTPEKKAMEAWQNFLANYDDGGALERIGNSPTGFEDKYGMYLIYTQEMADKLEEITAKYGLKLHTSMVDDLYTDEALCDQVGGDFLGENRAGSSYMYEDGTFHFDGDIDLPGYGLLDYQFTRCVRGSFSDVMLNIGNMTEYTEWVYTTGCGIPVTLAISPAKALVIADLPDSFVTINVLAGTQTPESDIFSSGPFQAEDLERFADSFDFSVLTPARPPDPTLARPSVEEALGTASPEEFYAATGIPEAEAQAFYAEVVKLAEDGERLTVAERMFYPAVVEVDGETIHVETPEEFLPHYDAIFTEGLWESIYINQYTKERADLFFHNGMVGAAGGSIWFAMTVDGRIGLITIQNQEGASIRCSAAG